MKKTVVMLLTATFLLLMTSIFACAESFSDEPVSFEVPEVFSSKTENSPDGADYRQWTNPETGSNVNVTVSGNNPKVCYADLSDAQLQAFQSSYVARLEKEIKDGLEMYSVGFEMLESNAKPVEIAGAKGLRLDMKIQYIYSDDNVVPADMTVCLFSTDENVIALSGTSKSDEEKEAVESFLQSVAINGEIYVAKSGTDFGIVGFVAIGAVVGGLVGLILAVTQKKKKQQASSATPQPVVSAENGEKPISPDPFDPDNA